METYTFRNTTDFLTEQIVIEADTYRDALNLLYDQFNVKWLHGIEWLTQDAEGYVYWKGRQVEHWSGDLPYSEHGRSEAEELSRRCLMLESRGELINTMTVIWKWPEVWTGPQFAMDAAKRICGAYNINGICDPAYIANVIVAELQKHENVSC